MTEDTIKRWVIWFNPPEKQQLKFNRIMLSKKQEPVKYPYACYIDASTRDVKDFFDSDPLEDRRNNWYRVGPMYDTGTHNLYSYKEAISVNEWMNQNG